MRTPSGDPRATRRAWLIALLVAPLLLSCAPPLECHRTEGDVSCEVSAWQRRRPVVYRSCRALGGASHGMRNELDQEIGDQYCVAEVFVPKRVSRGALVALIALLFVLRLRRRSS